MSCCPGMEGTAPKHSYNCPINKDYESYAIAAIVQLQSDNAALRSRIEKLEAVRKAAAIVVGPVLPPYDYEGDFNRLKWALKEAE